MLILSACSPYFSSTYTAFLDIINFMQKIDVSNLQIIFTFETVLNNIVFLKVVTKLPISDWTFPIT
uniref:Uncharacterized protein n=1 Tax=Arion vulgaris TaxID=1028688 RepID=A0A0B7ADW2_9EUPU